MLYASVFLSTKLLFPPPYFEGELGDYNTLVDKATVGHDISTIELDWEDVKAANERAEMTLERFFEERKKKEAQLKALEVEIEQVGHG